MNECFPSLLTGGARTLYIRPFVFKSLRTGSTSFLFPWTLWIIPCHLQNERFICMFLHRSLDSLVDTVVVTTSQHHIAQTQFQPRERLNDGGSAPNI